MTCDNSSLDMDTQTPTLARQSEALRKAFRSTLDALDTAAASAGDRDGMLSFLLDQADQAWTEAKLAREAYERTIRQQEART